MITRRVFLGVVAGGLLAAPLAAQAQQAGKVWRIGYLTLSPPERARHVLNLVEAGLRDLGYVPGKDVVIESYIANGDRDRLPVLARQLVNSHVDLILAQVNHETAAAKQATTTIPIVMLNGVNPVGSGFVASLSRPGGNITGMAFDATPVLRRTSSVDVADPLLLSTIATRPCAVRSLGGNRVRFVAELLPRGLLETETEDPRPRSLDYDLRVLVVPSCYQDGAA